MSHRLVNLNPKWFFVYNHLSGISFDCPACLEGKQVDEHGGRAFVFFDSWKRTGDTFDTLTLSPSILYRLPQPGGELAEHWHGWVTNGEVTSCG